MSESSQRLTTALAGRYRIERELGRGGMATVFLAEDLRHHRRVAIKVLDPELAAAIGSERFQREIETVAGLAHPHILPLHDSGQAAGLLYYVMPYVEGESLRRRLERETQLPVEEALRITREVAGALAHAHGRGVVHRDVKPENILLQDGHALLADFGIARAAVAGGEKLTATGIAIGTPAYMSPEQSVGGGHLDGRSDLYSLGCVLYEMLAGQAPFTGPRAESVVFQHLNAPPPKVTAIRPAVPAGIERAIVKAMAKTPADRHATAGDFEAALERGLAEPAARPRARVARWSALAVVALGALSSVAAWQSWWPFGGGAPPPPATKDWILVAEFDGPPGDSALAPAARSLLSAALDQSRIVATVPQDQIARALRLAGKPPTARVDATLARELAYRSAVRAVLEGTIGRLGSGYSIVLRVVDADTSRVILTASATAKDDNGLIPALGEMAKRLRRGLGENRRALAASRPMILLATPSFEAYRFFAEAEGRYRAGIGNREMLRSLRAAIALDPEFAGAWYRMAFLYMNLGYADSARACVEQALRWPERLSFQSRHRIETVLAALDGDDARGLAAFDRILADDPANASALMNSNDVLVRLGRVEEALARTRKGMALSPFGSGRVMRVNEVDDLTRLGRFDEARASNRQQTDIFRLPLLLNIECAAGRFALAESIAAADPLPPGLVDDVPEGLGVHLARARFGRGAVDAAAAALGEAVERCERARDVAGADYNRREWFELAVVSDGLLPFPPPAARGDTTVRLLLLRGLMAAEGRDAMAARRWLAAARARPPADVAQTGIEPTLLEARVAAVSGRPADAVRILRPIAAPFRGRAMSIGWPAWWIADAFERTSRPDSAAAYLERVGTVEFGAMEGAEGPYIHRRLALLYARLGRVADAERHLAAAEQAWDRPDPAVRRMLDETRAAVGAARAIARPPT